MSFGDNLKVARKNAGLTQTELGEALSVAMATIANWEGDRRTPTPQQIRQIAETLHTSADELLGIEKGPSEDEPVDVQKLYETLVDYGFVSAGSDLSDSDLQFLDSIAVLVRTWFNER